MSVRQLTALLTSSGGHSAVRPGGHLRSRDKGPEPKWLLRSMRDGVTLTGSRFIAIPKLRIAFNLNVRSVVRSMGSWVHIPVGWGLESEGVKAGGLKRAEIGGARPPLVNYAFGLRRLDGAQN
ncbi:unnamed protein product, partial [Iphiclides podalirius]